MSSVSSDTTIKKFPSPAAQDGITAVAFLSNELLCCTSWDGALRIFSKQDLKLVTLHQMNVGPLLSLACKEDEIYVGSLSGKILKFEIASSSIKEIASHDDCVSCLMFRNEVLISSSWDSHLKIFQNDEVKSSLVLPDKAFSMDAILVKDKIRVAVATANRRLVIVDVVNGQASIVLNRESSLKYQSRVVRFFPNGIGLAVGSIEGRVAIEFLNELQVESPDNMKKYAFKCHRKGDVVYPVNDIAFHPTYNTFATAGCDGTVVTWDGLAKKKLSVLPEFPQGISALAYSPDGMTLAIAVSYTFEEGDKYGDLDDNSRPKDELYLKTMSEKDYLPKKK